MRRFKDKYCSACGMSYTPRGSHSKYCPDCVEKETKRVAQASVYAWNVRKGILTGTGSGGKIGSDNQNYQHGRSVFRRWAKERKQTTGICEHCGKDIKYASHYEWVGHHKDYNPTNNVIENLVLLCKRCHQIEHKCHKAFEGVTTISKESRADNSSKPLALETGDDIV